MQKERRKSRVFGFILASLLIAAAFAGCSHNSSAPPGEDLTWKLPGIGSGYVETHYHGTLKMIGSQGSSDAYYNVTSKGSFEGKPNAITLGTGIEYIAFETNGDYSVLDSAFGYAQADWQRFPTGGGAAIMQSTDTTLYAMDSIQFLRDTIHVHKDFTRTFVGVENIQDGGTTKVTTYSTYKIHEVCVEDDSEMKFNQVTTPAITTFNTDYWIAPTIGWIVKDSTCDGNNWSRKILDGCTVN